MVKITIQKSVFNTHPKLRIGFLYLKDIDNYARIKSSQILLEETQDLVKLLYHKDTPHSHHLVSPWKLARLDLEGNVKSRHSAVERFLKATFRGRSLLTASVCENIIRFFLLKHMLPASSDDLGRVNGNIVFKLAKGNEKVNRFWKIEKGDLIYQDKEGVIGAKLSYLKCKRTRTGKKSKDLLLHFDALAPISNAELRKTMNECKDLLSGFVGGKIKSKILSKSKREAKF